MHFFLMNFLILLHVFNYYYNLEVLFKLQLTQTFCISFRGSFDFHVFILTETTSLFKCTTLVSGCLLHIYIQNHPFIPNVTLKRILKLLIVLFNHLLMCGFVSLITSKDMKKRYNHSLESPLQEYSINREEFK